MSRLEFIKRDKWRVLVLIAVTLSLPLMAQWNNPAGMQPVVIFGAIAAMGWFGLIGLLLMPPDYRSGFFGGIDE